MATTLQSPGVSVSVIDESFYTPAAPGTVPLIFVASAANKQNSSGTGIAKGTTAANAGKVWTITSQRDLADTFGTPSFLTDQNGNPVHGGELNEYGLQAAYSLLGVSSQAYVVRADLDLGQLLPKISVPAGLPVSGTYWLDTGNTLFGINEWDATNKVFTTKTPLIIDDSNSSVDTTGLVPNQSFGTIGSYAVVATSDNQAAVYYKNKDNRWSIVGSNNEVNFGSSISSSTFVSTSWASSWPVVSSTGFSNVSTGSSLTINGTTVTLGSDVTPAGVALSINSQLPQFFVGAKVNSSGVLELYADARATSQAITISGVAVTSLGFTAASYNLPSLVMSPHTQIPTFGTMKSPTGSIYVKTTSPGKGASWVMKLYNGATNSFSTVSAPLYGTSEAAIKALDITGGANIAVGTLFVEGDYNHGTAAAGKPNLATFKVWRRSAVSPTTVTGANTAFSVSTAANSGTVVYKFAISESVAGSAVMQNTSTITVATVASHTGTDVTTVNASTVVAAINGSGFANVSAKVNSDGTISISHKLGGDFQLTEQSTVGAILTTLGFTGYNVTAKTGTANLYASGSYDSYTYRATNWKPLVFEAKSTVPYTDAADQTLWYDSNLEDIDIMVHNGDTWVGYQSASSPYYGLGLDPNGPIISSTAPAAVGGHSDGTDLVDGDIWVDVSDTELYGKSIYVWNGTTLKWVKQDPTDQISENGWIFDDARWATSGQATEAATIKELLVSDYLDPDAPDPALYPRGTRLWNLRRSGFNIKKYVKNYIDIQENNGQNVRYANDPMNGAEMTEEYNPHRWVSVSPNNADGSGTFGRFAQRSFVVKAFKSLIDTNQIIRDHDTLIFNLMACPGYPETVANMVTLNQDRGGTAFVIGDTPFRLQPNGTDLAAWGKNTNGAFDNGDDGAVTYDEFAGFFYPSGYTTDNLGNNIVVPPSHMMLRTMTVSDQIAYPWFAPSGIRRGLVKNVTSVGYLENGEFKTTALPQNLRDVLYQAKVNPIATLNGVGITNFGNLTRASAASALDRINVARLVSYVRRQLSVLSQPYLFEPNDATTRREIKAAAESLLSEIASLRGLYDFIVVCNEDNNTQARIDRNELWMDIAIEPVKAIEFIYIPLRLVSTGSIKAGTFKLA